MLSISMTGAQLIQLAEEAAGSRDELAGRIGVHPRTLARWEDGDDIRGAFWRVLQAIADERPLSALHLKPTTAQHLAMQLECWPMTVYRCARQNDLFCGWCVIELAFSEDIAADVYGQAVRPPNIRSFFEARYIGPGGD